MPLLYLIIPNKKKKKKKVEINQVGHPLHIIIQPDPIAGITTQVKRKEKTQMGGGSKENISFSRVNDFLLFISNKQKKI